MSHVRFFAVALVAVLAPPASADKTKQGGVPASLKLGTAHRVIARHTHGICGVGFSPDGQLVATAGGDGVVRLTGRGSGKEVLAYKGHRDFLRVARFSPDGKLIVTGGNDSQIHLWDPKTGKEVRRLGKGLAHLYTAVFTPDGKTLVSGGFDEHIRVWDVATGQQRRAWKAHGRVVYALAVSPDGKTLASGGDHEGTLRLWDLDSGKELRRWEAHKGCVYSAAFSPDGRWLATGGGDTTAVLWEVASGKAVRRLDGHDAQGAFRVAFSPDGRLLATANKHKSVFLWELLSGQRVTELGDHQGWVWGLAYAPDGRSLLSGGHDSTAVHWDLVGLVAARAGRALTVKECEGLWEALAGEPDRAYVALASLLGDTKTAVPVLAGRLAPAKAAKVDAARVARLIAELDSDTFETRRNALAQLDRIGAAALPAVRRALVNPPSLEARRRLEELLRRHDDQSLSPAQLQAIRAVAVLEQAGTAAARRAVERLTTGDAGDPLTRHAAEVLRRMKR